LVYDAPVCGSIRRQSHGRQSNRTLYPEYEGKRSKSIGDLEYFPAKETAIKYKPRFTAEPQRPLRRFFF